MNTAALSDIRLQVTGMTCASCVMRVEKSLKAVTGVRQACVNLATEQASVSADPSVTADTLAAAVRKAGYDVDLLDFFEPFIPIGRLGWDGRHCAA